MEMTYIIIPRQGAGLAFAALLALRWIRYTASHDYGESTQCEVCTNS